ncbi:MAG: hypothetical protein BRC34_10745 [Cyanobacteria bacterium QH_1_48_107]|nr:MAG: hypothetical protein BRC34_10745 [Cyanobacteria bacterium QH_1_48_107]
MMHQHFGGPQPLRYFCMDESRWGLKTELGRGIALKGVKPVAPLQWPPAHCWLYGAVEVPSGQSLFYVFSHLDPVCFQRFLDHLAQQFPTSFHLLQLDQAGAHIATQLQWPAKVTPVFQPTASPERGPIERLWQELRERFRGRNFATLQDLQQWLFHQLNHLSERTIRSLTNWKFIRRAVHFAKKSAILFVIGIIPFLVVDARLLEIMPPY